MPIYHKLGDFPQKRHTVYDTTNNFLEQKVSTDIRLCYTTLTDQHKSKKS